MNNAFRWACGSTRLAALATFALAGTAQAQNFDTLEQLSGAQFEALVANLGAATHYKAIAPGEPLGVIGFDLGVGLSVTETDDELFELAGSDATDALDSLVLPRLHAHKGLLGGLDVGAFIGAIADTDLTLIGLEGRYAILPGSVVTPSLGIRLAASRLMGADELDLETYSAELVLSKGFVMLTPYAGIGLVRTVGDARDVDELGEVSLNEEKLFAGLNVNLGINLTFEADVSAEYATYSAKIGFRF